MNKNQYKSEKIVYSLYQQKSFITDLAQHSLLMVEAFKGDE